MRDRNLLALLLVSLLIAPVVVIQARLHSEATTEHQPLSLLPTQIGERRGADAGLDHGSLPELKRDDYLLREYHSAIGAQPPIDLFIEYEPVDSDLTIHVEEDMCLPGSGWVVIDRRRKSLFRADTSKFTANQSVMSKADDRMLVEYWYQIHGRTVA